ncbi:MAG: class I SAM-dependent methyltransferase [Pseudomonadales bacterium]|nr:class I SAM-dependent methyltransferase [Pseudomonadales bacterium]
MSELEYLPASVDVYTPTRAARYDTDHHRSLRARLTSRREQGNLLKALQFAGLQLAAPLDSALDLPCGTGRFWKPIQAAGIGKLIAGDISTGMLGVAAENRRSADLPAQLLKLSAFAIALPDDSVDVAICMRFYHHLSRAEDRLRLLAELKRVARRYIAISLWVDGNFRSWKAGDRFAATDEAGYGKRICRPRAEVEAEFSQAGLKIRRHYDVWPHLDMWRLYLLELPDAPSSS